MLELTEAQQQALAVQPAPLRLVDPRTQQVYVLVRQDVYEMTSRIVSGPNRRGWDDPADDDLIQPHP